MDWTAALHFLIADADGRRRDLRASLNELWASVESLATLDDVEQAESEVAKLEAYTADVLRQRFDEACAAGSSRAYLLTVRDELADVFPGLHLKEFDAFLARPEKRQRVEASAGVKLPCAPSPA